MAAAGSAWLDSQMVCIRSESSKSICCFLILTRLLLMCMETQLRTRNVLIRMFTRRLEKGDLLYRGDCKKKKKKSSTCCRATFCCVTQTVSKAFLRKKKNPCISCSKLMHRCLSWRSLRSPWTADTYRLLMNTTCRAAVISAADKCPAEELAKFKDKSSNLRPDKCVVWVGVELLLMSGYLLRALLTEIRRNHDWNPRF